LPFPVTCTNCGLGVQEKFLVADASKYLCITCSDRAGIEFTGTWPPHPIPFAAVAEAEEDECDDGDNVDELDVDFSALNKEDMVDFAAERGIELNMKMTRDQMIATLEAASQVA
jgi:hypothetical protein